MRIRSVKGSLRRRRIILVGVAAASVFVGVGMQVAAADGGVTITPDRGAPGTAYRVEVACGEQPKVYRENLQDDPPQGTIGPVAATDLAQTSPSVWTLEQVAKGQADAGYYATCDQADVGSARFDTEAPHLWFGPRPRLYSAEPRTRAEGTDCPTGTAAKVSIVADGKTTTTGATIDQYGDWSVPLPAPVGSVDLTITASCGDVTYDALTASPTTTTGSAQPPAPVPPAPASPSATTPNAPPASATPSAPNFTG
ncbi:MAG: hypothetical protein ACR2MB_11240 [Acidimicrobiales bacterium]